EQPRALHRRPYSREAGPAWIGCRFAASPAPGVLHAWTDPHKSSQRAVDPLHARFAFGVLPETPGVMHPKAVRPMLHHESGLKLARRAIPQANAVDCLQESY